MANKNPAVVALQICAHCRRDFRARRRNRVRYMQKAVGGVGHLVPPASHIAFCGEWI